MVACGALVWATEPSSPSPSFSASFAALVALVAAVDSADDGFTGAGVGAFEETELMDMAAFRSERNDCAASSTLAAQRESFKQKPHQPVYRSFHKELEAFFTLSLDLACVWCLVPRNCSA